MTEYKTEVGYVRPIYIIHLLLLFFFVWVYHFQIGGGANITVVQK